MSVNKNLVQFASWFNIKMVELPGSKSDKKFAAIRCERALYSHPGDVCDKNYVWIKLNHPNDPYGNFPSTPYWVLREISFHDTVNKAFLEAFNDINYYSKEQKALLRNMPDDVLNAIANCRWTELEMKDFFFNVKEIIQSDKSMLKIARSLKSTVELSVDELLRVARH